MQPTKRWPLRFSFREELRRGQKATGKIKNLSAQRNGFGDEIVGTAGLSHQVDPGRTLRIVQEMVQQGWTDAEIRTVVMRPNNAGTLWLRRQDDPDAELGKMLAVVDRGRRPHLPMIDRDERILIALADGGILSQKEILRRVDHPLSWQVRSDLARLEKVGAITIEEEHHGKVTWRRVSLAVAAWVFRDLASITRKSLAREIALDLMAKRAKFVWARRPKGCLSDPAGRTGAAGGPGVGDGSAPAIDDQKRRRPTPSRWSGPPPMTDAEEAEIVQEAVDHAFGYLLEIELPRLTLAQMAAADFEKSHVRAYRRPPGRAGFRPGGSRATGLDAAPGGVSVITRRSA